MELYYQQRPVLGLALDEEEETLIQNMLKWQSAEMEARWLSADDARQMEPRLTPANPGRWSGVGSRSDRQLSADAGAGAGCGNTRRHGVVA